ncbi:TPA: DUF4949 domain-containing protein [Legionella pneumophila]|nr:DUF4949 domain-containing protein [Legionella pneumophila]HAT8861224.1 DUF4949 domain-containing protein [Legionella pneumophila subsp. pneumophila]HAT6827527.1 DUF4949 domain-containing protein [Legionella pneumophila]HAT6892916.1 DUF4949 domain-containing protein [Legionella pneumophila]HAT6988395.1 DUF4949 domain-containing protein [Legionella pneumophila]
MRGIKNNSGVKNMMFQSKLATFFSALILAGSAFASQQGACPDINVIKAEGLPMAEEIGMNYYLAYNISDYSTSSVWGFFIAPIEADSEEGALEASNEVLSMMNAPGVPHQQDEDIICSYDTGTPNLIAAAIKDGSQISPMKLKQYFKSAR